MRRSAMAHSFAKVPHIAIPRSSFNRGHRVMTTFDADYLVPVLVDEVVPGDTFNVNMHFFVRTATPEFPIMDNMYLESFSFFVPYRIVWDNWKKMHGEQVNPADSIDFTTPIVNSGNAVGEGDLSDYMGLPIGLNTTGDNISVLPFRAYRAIWNYWFRDQNLQNSETVVTDDGPDSNSECGFANPPLKRCKKRDYFTSCLPWPQKGDAVTLPLGTSAPVATTITAGTQLRINRQSAVGTTVAQSVLDSNLATVDLGVDSAGSAMYTDLTNAIAPTLNDLRLAVQTSRLLERDARAGTRYKEMILGHFGVTVPDFRVQEPEYLGGGSTRINITPVAQTSGQPTPAAGDKLGNLAAIGTASGSHGFTKSFVEYVIVMTLVNVRSDITYSQGVERFWTKQTRYDYFYPVLAFIGEQAVLNQEIFHQDVAGTGAGQDQGVFGYQERYGEYRYKPSRLTGLFAVDAASSLSAWHLSADFGSLPTLGATFIESNTATPLDRAIQIPSEPQFWFDSYIDMQCARPMPLQGVPGNLDRF